MLTKGESTYSTADKTNLEHAATQKKKNHIEASYMVFLNGKEFPFVLQVGVAFINFSGARR